MTTPQPADTQAERAAEAKRTLWDIFEKHRRIIEAVLPKGETLERVVATVAIAVAKDETGMLGRCTPGSLVLATAKILSWGLEVGEGAFLVPFKDTKRGVVNAIPVIGYQGLAQLMLATGIVRSVEAHCVYANEQFTMIHGLDPILKHVPIDDEDARGDLVKAYALIRLPFGHAVYDAMSIKAVDKIRLKYSKQWKEGPCPPWYAEKTVLKQVAKLMPKSPKLARVFAAIEGDERIDELDGVEEAVLVSDATQPAPARATVARTALPMPRAEEVPVPQPQRVSVHTSAPYGETTEDAPTHVLEEMRMDDRRFEDDDPYNKPPY